MSPTARSWLYMYHGIGRLCAYTHIDRVSRKLSSSAKHEILKHHLTKHIVHRKLVTTEADSHPTPLAVLWPWLRAPQKALDRYCDLYHDLGWDVMTVQSHLQHFTWPKQALPIVHEFINALKQCHPTGPILVHGMSIGGFMYVVATDELRRTPTGIESRIIGQVHDSLVVGDLPQAVAEVTTTNRALQGVVRSCIDIYFKATRRSTWDVYAYYLEEIRQRPVMVPTLVFSSLNDPFCDQENLTQMVENWRRLPGMRVESQTWDCSEHAGHLRRHPEQYRHTLYEFINRLKSESKDEQGFR